jgi:hypothetical protein
MKYAAWSGHVPGRKAWGLPLILLAASLCGCPVSPGYGPCVHTYREPILNIVAAMDARSNAPIHSFVIHEVRMDGIKQDFYFLLAESYGVKAQGDSLVCQVPCGFGSEEGNYTFTVTAEGYPAQVRGYEGHYSIFHGGCPSYNDGGARVTLRLQKDANEPG